MGYKSDAAQLVRMRRQAKQSGNFFVEPEAKMMLVVRISGINKMAPKPKKILKLLRLDQLHKAVFVKCTKPMLNMIKCIMPYIVCGYPNLKTYGIHGVDDLIHEIYKVGPAFKQANSFLWAFKLSSPNGGWVQKKHGFHEPKGGDWGNREEMINELVRRMM